MLEYFFLFCLIVYFLNSLTKRPENFPPGPRHLPILGNLLTCFRENPLELFNELEEDIGPLSGLVVPGFTVLVVNGWEAIKQVMVNEDCQGRPDVCLIKDRFQGENYGVLFTDEDSWKEQRRFTLHHFRNIGFGKKYHESIVADEAQELVSDIKALNGEPFSPEGYLYLSNINITWAMIASHRHSHSEEQLRLIAEAIRDMIHDLNAFGSLATLLPWTRYVFPESTGYTTIMRGSTNMRYFIKKSIEEHEKTRESGNPRDFIDFYLEELDTFDVTDKVNSFSRLQLEGVCMDLLLAGGDTTTSTVTFAILYLCVYPDIQAKIHDEIINVVGEGRQVTMEDKTRMTYTDAFIMEVFRNRTPAPNYVPHRVTRDTEVMGYNVPKDTVIFPNIVSVFMDKEHWGDPENFRPERFITEEGKIRRDERLIPFGRGKRSCIGETLGKMASFILLSTMVQHFSFSLPPNAPIPDTEGVPGFILGPPDFKVIATPRKKEQQYEFTSRSI